MSSLRRLLAITILVAGLVVPAARAQDGVYAYAVNFSRNYHFCTNLLNAAEHALRVGNLTMHGRWHFTAEHYGRDAQNLAQHALTYYVRNASTPFGQNLRVMLLGMDDLCRRIEALRRR
jgi:hypothetical protein